MFLSNFSSPLDQRFAYCVLLKASITALASSSTMRDAMLRLQHIIRHSLRPHNSAIKQLVIPMRLVKPENQFPQPSLITSSQPATPRLPNTDPFVLSFIHPARGFSHLILLTHLRVINLGEAIQCTNSTVWFSIST